MNLKFRKLQIQVAATERGLYQIVEPKNFDLSFTIKRVYFVQNFKQPTGQHCHKIEEEIFILVKGSCVAVIDRGAGKEDLPFTSSGEALYVGTYVWHGFKEFSPDAILLALSSTNYNPDRSDYIENYEEYQKIVAAN